MIKFKSQKNLEKAEDQDNQMRISLAQPVEPIK